MSWVDEFNNAVLEFSGAEDGSTLTSIYSSSWDSGYCETCASIEHEVEIRWRTKEGNPGSWTYNGRLEELITKVTDRAVARERRS